METVMSIFSFVGLILTVFLLTLMLVIGVSLLIANKVLEVFRDLNSETLRGIATGINAYANDREGQENFRDMMLGRKIPKPEPAESEVAEE